jgi:hypothetical protein
MYINIMRVMLWGKIKMAQMTNNIRCFWHKAQGKIFVLDPVLLPHFRFNDNCDLTEHSSCSLRFQKVTMINKIYKRYMMKIDISFAVWILNTLF